MLLDLVIKGFPNTVLAVSWTPERHDIENIAGTRTGRMRMVEGITFGTADKIQFQRDWPFSFGVRATISHMKTNITSRAQPTIWASQTNDPAGKNTPHRHKTERLEYLTHNADDRSINPNDR